MSHVDDLVVDAPSKPVAEAHDSAHEDVKPLDAGEQQQAAQLIQRNYRGYRERRQLKGHGLDAAARWHEALKEAKWRNATRPMSPPQRARREDVSTPDDMSRAASEAARNNWKRVGEVARRAGGDDPEDASQNDSDMSEDTRHELSRRKAREKAGREKAAKMMDLQYFLEMVDQKHRYGSNLRAYHDHWKQQDTHENFFYWLDQGAGRRYEHPTVTRERLEKEQVRYLSREERLQYLVTIDKDGRLRWAKNGERISTTMDFKDSINGVVPRGDNVPTFGPGGKIEGGDSRPGSSSSSSSSEAQDDAEHSDIEGEHYVNEDLKHAKGLSKIKHVSAATILNHLLRGSVKPNSWIFVADTSFRLYVGIKQSGAFQHSSFLHGARIASAGLIKIKDGQLRRLSPLSGHYRPPTKNFRAFVHSLQDHGVDMSRVSISRSYAVLVGLEAYVKTRRKFKHGVQHASDLETKVVHPEAYKQKLEAEKDKSQSAEKERKILAVKAEKAGQERRERNPVLRVWRKLKHGSSSSTTSARKQVEAEEAAEVEADKQPLSEPGQDAEDGIPPAGTR